MKAFGLAVICAVLLAVVAGFVLEGTFSREADQAYSAPSARVGEGPSVEHRNFSGERR
ncbi:hypothetical protein [Azospirillum soli]|uniref:hypothetical protein n=1 Tax=Azospirillum soli TaxID=1304799 RepID=UPI001AE404D5|nr:hypothetical protein [Azospirillum soli]MBP2316754.1 hypothetical protein [Azospirillum soli]